MKSHIVIRVNDETTIEKALHELKEAKSQIEHQIPILEWMLKMIRAGHWKDQLKGETQ